MHHIYRESNRVADFMASLGHNAQVGIIYFLLPPVGVGSILREDIAGVSMPRVVS